MSWLPYHFLISEEFVAHGASVNCVSLGHKSGRVLVTGGDDKKVNLWAVGKPNCIMVRHCFQMSIFIFPFLWWNNIILAFIQIFLQFIDLFTKSNFIDEQNESNEYIYCHKNIKFQTRKELLGNFYTFPKWITKCYNFCYAL